MDQSTHDVRRASCHNADGSIICRISCSGKTHGSRSCGGRSDRIKGLLWMGTGFLLLYKRFKAGRLSWSRTTQEAADLTEEQFHYLMMGLNPLEPRIKDVSPQKIY